MVSNYWKKHKDYAENVASIGVHSVRVDSDPFYFQGIAPRGLYGNEERGPNYAEIAKHYELEYKGGGERVSVLKNLDDIVKGRISELVLGGVTSIDVAAESNGRIKPFPHLALIGAVFTKDNKIIVGVRGRRYGKELTPERVKSFADNCYALAPGGILTFCYNENPLDYTLEHEAMEELGIKKEEIKGHNPISIFKSLKMGPLGYKILEFVETRLSSKEIIEKHKSAYEKYLSLCKEGVKEKDACNKIAEEFECGACWEHSELLALSANPDHIGEFIDKIPSVENINSTNYLHHKKCGIGMGGLISVADYLDAY